MNLPISVTQKWKRYYGIMATIFILLSALEIFSFLSNLFSLTTLPNLEQRISFPFLSLFFIFLAGQFIYGYFQTIILTSKSIKHRAFGINADVKWANVKRVGKYERGFWQFDGLYFDKSKDNLEIWLPGMYLGQSEVFIPLSMFADNWRTSEIGQQIKQYAPHLFELEIQESVPSA